MTWVFAILLVLLLGGVAFVAAGKGAPMAEEYDDRPDATVPATGRLTGVDLRRVRFSLAFRGYRMSEVDALLDRLATEREQEERHRPPSDADSTPDDSADDPPATPRGPEPPA